MKKELNKLLKLNLDASKGYEYAAETIKNENFKNFLSTYSRQREKNANQIRTTMIESGFEANYDTSKLGDMHQRFMKFKDQLGDRSDDDLVEECIRGEKESQVQYEKILKSDMLPKKMHKMALEHLNKIRAAESTLREIHHVL